VAEDHDQIIQMRTQLRDMSAGSSRWP
jgi:hypothetical protein